MTHVLIVGAGHAGGRLAQHLAALGFAGTVTLLGDEAHPPYERPPLSKGYLAGTQAAEDCHLPIGAASTVQGHVERIDIARRIATLSDGRELGYDRLVLATGTIARVLPIAGGDRSHVHVLRTLDDATRLRAAMSKARRLVVIGGGVIGLEVAATARAIDLPVTVLEAGERAMERILTPRASAWLEQRHRDHGVDLRKGVRVLEIGADDITFEQIGGGRETILTGCVLIAAGAVPTLPEIVGGTIDVSDGILVDGWCRVPVQPEIFAIGDVARMPDGPVNCRQETWRNAENGARAVAEILCGAEDAYRELPWMWSDQYGDNIQVLGAPLTGNAEIVRGDLAANQASLFYLAGGRLAGAVLINDARSRRVAEGWLASGATIDPAQLADITVPLKAVA